MSEVTNEQSQTEIPARITEKINLLNVDVESLLTEAQAIIQNPFLYKFSFRARNSDPVPSLSNQTTSAFFSFVNKFRDTPNFDQPNIVKDGEKFKLVNIDLARHVLNEWRPVFFNKKDSIFYERIHNSIAKMFPGIGTEPGTKITVTDSNNGNADITNNYFLYMGQCRKALSTSLSRLDLDYLYNGVLQHSDIRFNHRYQEDQHTGELNYILIKNAFVMSRLRELLKPYHWCASIFWVPGFPNLGGL